MKKRAESFQNKGSEKIKENKREKYNWMQLDNHEGGGVEKCKDWNWIQARYSTKEAMGLWHYGKWMKGESERT